MDQLPPLRDIAYYVSLQRRLYEIFPYVSCHGRNFGTYSIKIESALVDICSFFDSLSQQTIRELASEGRQFEKPPDMEKFRKKLAGKEHFNAGDYKDLLGKELQLSSKTVSLEAYEDNPYRNPQHRRCLTGDPDLKSLSLKFGLL